MDIVAITLYRDTLNFFRNQFVNIMLLTILTASISMVLGHALSPNNEQLMRLSDYTHMKYTTHMNLQQLLQKMSTEQQQILLQVTVSAGLSGLVGNILLTSGVLTMVHLVSNYQSVNILRAISVSTFLWPRLFLLIFLSTFLIQLGFFFIVIPGILLTIAFSFAPIIATSENLSVIKSIRTSTNLAFSNLQLLTPATLFFLLSKSVLLILVSQCAFPASLALGISLNSLSNLFSSLFLIYLYRLYMLLKQSQ